MRVIELTPEPPSLIMLLDAVKHGDVVLVRNGRPVARLEKFTPEDLADWKYEHSREAIARGDAARREYREGKFRPLSRQKARRRRRGKTARK